MIILVTGGGGFLGGHLLRVIPQGHEVVALIRNSRAPHGTAVVEADLSKTEEVEQALQIVEPSAIFHLAAQADAALCEKDPEYTFRVNVESTKVLAEYAARVNIPLVFTSTDLVFDGSKAPYSPYASPHPLMTYGRQKAEAEEEVRSICADAIIARLPLLYGASGDGLLNHARKGMLTTMLNNLRAGKTLKFFTDEYRTMANARRVAEGLWKFGAEKISGTWNFGAPERFSRYDFARQTADFFELDKSLIIPVKQSDLQTGSARPADVSLDSSASFEVGYVHGTLREELRVIRAGSKPYR